jgi:hypothetical protein
MNDKRPGNGAHGILPLEELGSFDAGRAMGHVAQLCDPRRTGTPGERRAARYIAAEFAALGLTWRKEPFAVPRTAIAIFNGLALLGSALLLFIGVRLGVSSPILAAACWCGAGALLNGPWRLTRTFGRRLPSRIVSANLVASLPDDDPDEAPARVVFMAHYDSKSQVLPTGIRVGLVVLASALCGLLAAVGLGAALGNTHFMRSMLPGALSACVAAVLAILAANVTGNCSPGALDNGSGLGTLLELARTWRPQAGMPAEVYFVATGAEEDGLVGARDFLDRRGTWWREKPTLLINLDSVGAGDRVCLAGEPRALRLARKAAESLEISHTLLRVLGAGMDHEPFAAQGLAAVSVLGDVIAGSLVFHSARDHLGQLERPAMQRAGRLAGEVASAWVRSLGEWDAEGEDRGLAADRVPAAVSVAS